LAKSQLRKKPAAFCRRFRWTNFRNTGLSRALRYFPAACRRQKRQVKSLRHFLRPIRPTADTADRTTRQREP